MWHYTSNKKLVIQNLSENETQNIKYKKYFIQLI